ncbi:MAG: copper resistance protein CopC [Candidatus Nitrosocosmicus sp.]|nr:copper resistance protein CopC [Candidatus Nitrosocosmicus sp.]
MNSIVITFFAILFIMGNSLSLLQVYGHASPITYDPSPNEIIDSIQSVPDKVTISFTESPEPRASSIKVVNSNNERIDKNDLQVLDAEKSLSISLDKSKVVPGTYTVDWIVLSKDDGHITKGSYVFSVADDSIQNQQQQVQQNSTEVSSGYSKNVTTPDNMILTFDISPNKVGQNTFNLFTTHTNGTAVENIRNVFLEFNNPTKSLGPIADTMDKIDSGKYSSVGNYLSQNGTWEIKVTVQRIGDYDINQQFDIEIK